MDFLKCQRTFIYTNSWGYYSNGSWTGLMGYLTRGEVELGGKLSNTYLFLILVSLFIKIKNTRLSYAGFAFVVFLLSLTCIKVKTWIKIKTTRNLSFIKVNNTFIYFTGSPMFFLKERTYFVDYLSSPTHTKAKFMFRQPPLSYENNLYLLTFKTAVWYCSLGLIFILLLVLFISAYWEYGHTDHYVSS